MRRDGTRFSVSSAHVSVGADVVDAGVGDDDESGVAISAPAAPAVVCR